MSSALSFFDHFAALEEPRVERTRHHPLMNIVFIAVCAMLSGANDFVGMEKFGHKRSRDELRNDVHLSFDYAMRQGVFVSNDPLSEEKAEILFDWFLLLQKALPPTWTALHAVIKELIDNFLYVKRSEEYMLLILEENPPQNTVWSMACSHGEPDVGYTCGLWELFHVVTVGFVDFNRASVFSGNRLATEAVARMIRDYVDRFFGCEICRHNFVTAFDACALNRCERLLWNATDEETADRRGPRGLEVGATRHERASGHSAPR